MFFQRGKKDLNDYLMMNLEWKVFDEKLKIAPVTLVGEVHDWDHVKDNYAVVWTPYISYYPVDNAEIKIGYHFLDGKDTTVFGKMRNADDAYLQTRYSF
ncbi:MAG: hypothetical protein HQK54_04445 [Oligoflexales bacterium]|nr:hypothetical protein [Oligoflexales bacterium]